jgi:NTE family protein
VPRSAASDESPVRRAGSEAGRRPDDAGDVEQRVRPGPFRYSIVLGAGGRPGLAYHAGTLLALELHGLTPFAAVSLTGTSAGAIAAGVLVAGGTVEDLAAYSVGAMPRPEFGAMAALIQAADRRPSRLDARALRHVVDVRRLPSAIAHLRAGRLLPAWLAAVPGLVAISRRFDFLDTAASAEQRHRWRIVAADVRAGRYVFTPGQAPLSVAVAASCAVPGVFAPVWHDGHTFVDGGVHSTTNADLALEDDGEMVIVLAPMALQEPGSTDVRSPSNILAREVAELEAAGRTVVVFRPSASLHRRMGRNPLAGKRMREITAAAVLEASDVLTAIHSPRRGIA